MVPGAGLEPARPQGRGILSLSRTTLALTGIHTNPGKFRITALFIECQYEPECVELWSKLHRNCTKKRSAKCTALPAPIGGWSISLSEHPLLAPTGHYRRA